jgi:ATP-binding cassette subfamily G (WHITE) protein 2 (PDR)
MWDYHQPADCLQILTLYAQRPIVEKQARYAMYHPFAEAIASMLCDMPYKITNAIIFNLTLYFMTNLRREPGAFFVFLLFSFVTTLTMSMLFRTMAASSRTLSQALVPAAILILGLVIYTGFTIPTRNMLGWSRWMNYIDPIAYGFESLMVNEFHNRQFLCPDSAFVPSSGAYDSQPLAYRVCSTVGSVSGSRYVQGDDYLNQSFQYYKSHQWRNLGIMFGFMFFFMFTYLTATEYISESKSKGEVLLFRRGHAQPTGSHDVEKSPEVSSAAKTDEASSKEATGAIQRQEAIFQWKDVCYDIKIKGEPRRILDHVDGWVKPGTCTALMVCSYSKRAPRKVLTANVINRVSPVLVRRHFWMCSRPV